MKKIFLIIGLFTLTMTMGVFTSCGDNTDVCSPHVLSDAETAEMQRQDSIKEALRKKINADLVLEYTVDAYPSSTQYSGGSVKVDMDAIAQLFGITKDELVAGISGEEGAPSITKYAMQGELHTKYTGAATGDGLWGNWWAADATVANWGDKNSAFFTNWNGEDGFEVGQYPGKLNGGETMYGIQCLEYGGKTVAIKITFNLLVREEIAGTIVDTKEYQLAEDVDSNYVATPVTIDMDGILSKLGVSSVDDVTVIGFKEDGSYANEFTADLGYWLTKDGFTCSWGDTAYAFVNYMGKAEGEDKDPNMLTVGQMPKAAQSGDVVSLPIGFYANKKIVKVIVKLTIN